jgi:hypothetical protein
VSHEKENEIGITTDTTVCKVMAVLTFIYESELWVVRRKL